MHFKYLWRLNIIRSHLLMKYKLFQAMILIFIISAGSKAMPLTRKTSKSNKIPSSAANSNSNLGFKSKVSSKSVSKVSSTHYLLTVKELKALSPKDRTKYFLLLLHLIARVEIIEGSEKTLEVIQSSQMNQPSRSSHVDKYSLLTLLSESTAFAIGSESGRSSLKLDFGKPFNIQQMVSELEKGTDKLRAEELLKTISGRKKLIDNVKANSASGGLAENQQWTNTNNKMVENLEWTQNNEKRELEEILNRLHPDWNKQQEAEIVAPPRAFDIAKAINNLSTEEEKSEAIALRESSKKYRNLIEALESDQSLRGTQKNTQLIIEYQKKKNAVDRKLYQVLDLKVDEKSKDEPDRKVTDKSHVLDKPNNEMDSVTGSWLEGASKTGYRSSVSLMATGSTGEGKQTEFPVWDSVGKGTHSESQNNKIMGLKKVGNPCIFGLWKSEYKEMKDRSVKCPRPADSIDSPLCDEKNGKKMFRCNYLGIKINGAPPSGSCIPLIENNGLNDLTVRCAHATKSWVNELMNQTSHTGMSAEDYNKLTQDISNALDALETSRADTHKQSFKDYCNDHKNYQLTSLQKVECDSLIELISELRGLKEKVSDKTQTEPTPSCDQGDCSTQAQ